MSEMNVVQGMPRNVLEAWVRISEQKTELMRQAKVALDENEQERALHLAEQSDRLFLDQQALRKEWYAP